MSGASSRAGAGAPPAPADAFAGRTFDAVLFDFDGTLADSRASVERCWLRWAREEGVPLQRLLGCHGMTAREIVDALLPPERADAAFARILRYELTDVDGIVALPGARAALDALGAGRAAVVTSCTRDLLLARGRAAGIALPPTVVTADDVARGKPHPEPYLTGAARLGADPARCLVVEDAPAGLAAGRAAGCATLAVGDTHDVREPDADAAAPTLAQVRFVSAPDGVAVAAA